MFLHTTPRWTGILFPIDFFGKKQAIPPISKSESVLHRLRTLRRSFPSEYIVNIEF